MGVRLPSVFSNAFVGPLPASVAETVILVSPPISEPIDNAQILIFWACSILPGTSVTAHQFRVRRGNGITGALVTASVWTDATTAAISTTSAGVYFDAPGAVAGQQYSLTVVQGGATGAGTFNDGCILAMVL